MAERLFGTDGLRGTVNNYPMTVDVALRLGLARRESPEEEPKKNGSDTRKDA